MSQDFKTNFDRMFEFDAVPQEAASDKHQEHYIETGHYRNLCFQWQDGRMLFLSYSYLVCCEYLPDAGCIQIEFTTYDIIIKGVKLEQLFFLFMSQQARLVTCTDERYNALNDSTFTINEIIANRKE